MIALDLLGAPAPFRESVLAAIDRQSPAGDESAELAAFRLTAVYCDSEARWDDLERHAQVDGASEDRTIAIITELDLDDYHRALTIGADGVVHADTSSSIIVSVAEAACRGETILPTFVAHALAAKLARRQPPCELSSRESEILTHLSQGARISDLADRFAYSERTIRRHLQSLYLKIGAKTRADAIRFAATHLDV